MEMADTGATSDLDRKAIIESSNPSCRRSERKMGKTAGKNSWTY